MIMQQLSGKIETAQRSVCTTFPSLTNSTFEVLNMAKESLPNSISTNKLCSIAGCAHIVSSRSFCGKHLYRVKKYGSPFITTKSFGSGNTREERFWSKVDKTSNPNGCWEWLGTVNHLGYGKTKFQGKHMTTHRVAWLLTYGVTPNFLLHSCDNAKCANPSHLREGTPQENMKDKVERNRSAKGEGHGMSKLKDSDVRQIKQMLASGDTQTRIAEMFGVSQFLVSCIKLGKNWTHIK